MTTAPETTADLRICRRDGEPLVFTFEYPGAEYVCVVCDAKEDIFGNRAPATVERQQRHADLHEQYHRAYAERRGVPYDPSPKVGDPGVEVPTCNACGAQPATGTVLVSGKPSGWHSRSRDGVREYACGRSCIPAGETVLPW